jgi:hypothetical protein
MNRELLIIRALQALIFIQLFIGFFSVVTLNVGRGVAVFASAALIYLGMKIVGHLAGIQEMLSYSATQPVSSQHATVTQPANKERVNVKTFLKQKRTASYAPSMDKADSEQRSSESDSAENTVTPNKRLPSKDVKHEQRENEVSYETPSARPTPPSRHDVR